MASEPSDPGRAPVKRRASLLRTADVAPVDVDGLAAVVVGLGVWLVALVLMLIFHDRLVASRRGWWLTTDLIALGLGLFGLYYCLRRRSRLRRGLSADPSEGRFVRRK
jgi:hypothetical protein